MIPAPPPRWQDVAQLALTHPVVYRAVSHHHAGDLTREEALSVMVLALAEALSDTQEHLARLLAPSRDCPICRLSGQRYCWAWHRYAKAELNPIVLLRRMTPDSTVGEIVEYVRAATGISADLREIAP